MYPGSVRTRRGRERRGPPRGARLSVRVRARAVPRGHCTPPRAGVNLRRALHRLRNRSAFRDGGRCDEPARVLVYTQWISSVVR